MIPFQISFRTFGALPAVTHVNIRLSVPGEDIVINREPEKNPDHRDLFIAVRDAFDAAERQLEDRVRRRRLLIRRNKNRSGPTPIREQRII